MRILVFGASGTVGSRLVQQLLADGHQVRGTTRHPERHEGPPPGLDWAAYDGSPEAAALDPLFGGTERAFLLAPDGVPDMYAHLSPLISAAHRHRLRKVVMMTGMGPDEGPQIPFRQAEAELRNTGVPFHVLRPNWFMQNFHRHWGEEIRRTGKLRVPAGSAKVSFIDSRDISEVAAVLLTNDDFASQTDTLTGGEALTHAEVARHISEASGRDVMLENLTPAEFHAALVAEGMPPEGAGMMNELFDQIRDGHLAEVTDAVKAILGRPPRTFADYVQEFAAAWKE